MLASVDVRLIEYFVAVVDHGGITKAANALYLAQPSLSQAIRGLEREVGTELFDRGGRRLELTKAGRAFEVRARRVIRDVELAREKVEEVREMRTGRLQVAAVPDLTLHPLPGVVRRLRDAHPGIEVRVRDPGGPSGVVAAVRRGNAELGLTTLPVKAESLTVERLRGQRLVLAMAPELAARLPDPVPQAMLGELPLIREIDDGLPALLDDPDVLAHDAPGAIRCGLRQMAWDLVLSGAGMAVLAEGFVRTQFGDDVHRRDLEPELRRQIGLVYRAGQLSPAGQAFIELLRTAEA
jgi:DNA-binding transcriptional LysR family regulator